MCVCVHMCFVYVPTCVCLCICTCVLVMYAHVCLCIFLFHICTWICVYAHVCVSVYVYASMYVHLWICICACVCVFKANIWYFCFSFFSSIKLRVMFTISTSHLGNAELAKEDSKLSLLSLCHHPRGQYSVPRLPLSIITPQHQISVQNSPSLRPSFFYYY